MTPDFSTTLSRSVSAQLPPCSAARSTITEPCAMPTTAPERDELRRRLAGDQRGRDDDVRRLRVLRDERLLGREVRVAHLLGVAARALARLLELELDELRAQALDLLAHGRPRVERAHHRAQPPRRGDRGQARDARAEDQHLRRLHAPGRGHLPGEEAPEVVGRLDDRAVAGDVRHRRQRVQLLRARDARHGVHREHRHLARRQALDERLVLRRPDEADQRAARLQQVGLVPAARPRASAGGP